MSRSHGTHVTVEKCVVQGIVAHPEKKRKPEINKPRCEDNIKVDIQKTERKNLEWI